MADSLLMISRILSYSVILLSFCMKLPQISAIYRAKSSRGVNVRGSWMELASFIIACAYAYFYDFHLTTYADALLLAMQTALTIFLAVYFSSQWNVENAIWGVVTTIFTAVAIVKAVPPSVLSVLLLLTLPLAAAYRFSQMSELYSMKTQGDVSALMWFLDAYACAARIFTTAVEIQDLLILVNFLVCFLLDLVVLGQCAYYGSAPPKKID